MLYLVLILVLGGGTRRGDEIGRATAKHCLLSCFVEYEGEDCLYDEAATCGRRGECIESKVRTCRPRVVNLGTWDPVPISARRARVRINFAPYLPY